MAVVIDGATLSALLFENFHSTSGCQYGFLLGEKVEQIVAGVSDSQMHTETVSSYTYISSFLPWPWPVFSRTGGLDEALLDRLLPDQALIGWYSFRRNSSLRPSLKENTFHRKLAKCRRFSHSLQDLGFLLVTASHRTAVQSSNHTFYNLVKGQFVKSEMSTLNLGDTTRKEYRCRSQATLAHSHTLHTLFDQHRKSLIQSDGQPGQVVKVAKMAESINSSLLAMRKELWQRESTVGNLEREVKDLAALVDELEEEERALTLQTTEENNRKEMEEQCERSQERSCVEEQTELIGLMNGVGIEFTHRDQSNLRPIRLMDDSKQLDTDGEQLGPATCDSRGKGSSPSNRDVHAAHNSDSSQSDMSTSGNAERIEISSGNTDTRPGNTDPFASLGDVNKLGKALNIASSRGRRKEEVDKSRSSSEEVPARGRRRREAQPTARKNLRTGRENVEKILTCEFDENETVPSGSPLF